MAHAENVSRIRRLMDHYETPFRAVPYEGLPGWEVRDARGAVVAVQLMDDGVASLVVDTLNAAVCT